MKIWITMRSSNYAFSWALDDSAREHFEEAHDEGESWDEWVKPISVGEEDLDELNGEHILFGQVESMRQSDVFPHMAFLYANNGVIYELKHVEDDE